MDSIHAYAHDLNKSVQLYYQIINPSDSPFTEEQKVILIQLDRLGWGYGGLLATLAGVLAAKEPSELTAFLGELERHVFLMNLWPRDTSTETSFNLFGSALAVAGQSSSISDLTSKLHTHNEKHLARGVSHRAIRARNFYEWGAIRYFLFEYEQALKARSRSKRDKLSWEQFTSEDFGYDYVTVEHVYPQKATHSSWKAVFANFEIKQRNALRNSLGNLAALSKPKNSSLSNRAFEDKKAGAKDRPGYRAGSYSEIEIAEHDIWDAHAIYHRGLAMLSFLEDRWSVSLGDEKSKARYLGLGFMLEMKQTESLDKNPNAEKV